MLQKNDPAQIPAAETRVSTHELTSALASMDSRKTREAFARVGTVTLAEGLRDSDVEATPEELYAEIEALRLADAAQEEVKRRQRRLGLILKAEIVSAALCFAALLGFQQTLYNLAWQQARQVQEFQDHLRLSGGLHPKYDVREIFVSTRSWGPNGETATTPGAGAAGPAYPAYLLPDGINVHTNGGLIEDGQNQNFGYSLFAPPETQYVEFMDVAPQGQASFRETLSVIYNGAAYRRGWVRKSDVPRVLSGHGFTFYLAPVSESLYQTDIVPLTLSQQSIDNAHGQRSQSISDRHDMFTFLDGSHVSLDAHAWEQYQAPPKGN